MPVSLLFAPAAHGKTRHALAQIRAVRSRQPLALIYVIVPNRIQLINFRARIAGEGGALGVALFTFFDLYTELLAMAGQALPRLDSLAQIRLVRAVVDELAAGGSLPYFAPLQAKPGFAAALREAIEDLKRARILPEQLEAAVQGDAGVGQPPLAPRLQELAAIYAAYQARLRASDWADPEGLGWLAEIALRDDPRLGGDAALLIADGFDEFNPTQLAVLAHLAARAGQTLVTLTGDPDRPRLAHRRFKRAEQSLRAALEAVQAGQAVTNADAAHGRAEDLRWLERNLFEPAPAFGGPPTSVTFLEAQNRAFEVRAALRWVKQRVVNDGVAPDQAAILARSLEPYRPHLEEAAREFGVPLRIVGGAPLAESPLVAALMNLLALPTARVNWRPRSLLAAWRSPYFDWSAAGLSLEHAATVEAVARAGRVVAGLAQWREALQQAAGASAGRPEDGGDDGSSLPSPLAAADAGAAFEALVSRLAVPPRASRRAHIQFVEDLIGDDPETDTRRAPAEPDRSLRMVERALSEPATAERDVAALQALKEVLRGLVVADADIQAGAGELDYAEFIAELHEGIQASAYELPDSGGVFAASVLDARGLTFRALAVLGLAEGEFPRAEREMPLLREADRDALRQRGVALETRLRGDETTIFYETVTRTTERLLLCRPYLADDGQAWEPSTYWRQASRLMGEPPVLIARPETRLAPEQVASETEWVEQGYDLDAVRLGRAVLAARSAEAAAGHYEGELPELAPGLASLHPPERSWSASRLEAYGVCGFYYYVAHVLKLEPRDEPEAGYDARHLGSMYHNILEALYSGAPDAADLDALHARLTMVAAREFAAAPAKHGFRPTALWAQQQAELLRILKSTVAALHDISTGWTPRHFEQRFGFGAPPLRLTTPAGEISLHGYIDRIDVNAEGRLRVVDYKTGGAYIGDKDLIAGTRLQLPLYALGARDALGLGEPADGFYWHIGSAEPSKLQLSKFDGGVSAAFEAAAVHVGAHVGGVLGGQFQPRPPEGGCPNYCPAAAFCWRFAPRRF